LDPIVFFAVIAAAVMHATWNALVKVSGDRLFSMAVMMFTHSLLAAPFVFYFGFPDPNAWIWIGLSVVIHLFYYLAVVNQYRYGDLSYVYPMSRGSAPLLVCFIAYFFVGEALTTTGVIAIIVISLGILALAAPPRLKFTLPGKATMAALFTAITIAGYTFVDGMGGRADPEVFRYIAWLFVFEGVPLLIIVLIRRTPAELISSWNTIGLKSLFGGALSTAAYALVIWAMSLSPLAAVSALRETSVIFAALIGTYLMKETLGPRRIAASTLVATGVVILQIAGRS